MTKTKTQIQKKIGTKSGTKKTNIKRINQIMKKKKGNILPIDIVAVNLYPFEETVGKNAGFEEAVENIDIGGPSLVRAAAKNFNDVLVIVNPKDYNDTLNALKSSKNSKNFLGHKKSQSDFFVRLEKQSFPKV